MPHSEPATLATIVVVQAIDQVAVENDDGSLRITGVPPRSAGPKSRKSPALLNSPQVVPVSEAQWFSCYC